MQVSLGKQQLDAKNISEEELQKILSSINIKAAVSYNQDIEAVKRSIKAYQDKKAQDDANFQVQMNNIGNNSPNQDKNTDNSLSSLEDFKK